MHLNVPKQNDSSQSTGWILANDARLRTLSDPPISASRKLCYALGGFSKSCLTNIVNVYFTQYLLTAVKLPANYASICIFLGRILDACSDPAVGYLMARSNWSIGKYRPWIVGVVPFGCAAYILLWYIPRISAAYQTLYYIVTYWLYSLTTTLFLVPYKAVVLAASNNPKERESIIGYRTAMESLGNIVGLAIHAVVLFEKEIVAQNPCAHQSDDHPEIEDEELANKQQAYLISAGILCSINAICSVIAFFSLYEEYDLHIDRVNVKRLFGHYVQIFRFKPFRLLSAYFLCITIAHFIFLGNYALYFRYVFYAYHLFPILILLIYLVTSCCTPIWSRFARKVGKKTTMTVATFPLMVVLWSHLFLKNNIYLIVAVCVAIGFLFSASLLVPQSMTPDVIAEYSVAFGHGKESLIYTVISCVDKLGNGLMLGFTTLSLQLVHFDASHCEQSPNVELMMRLIVGAIPVLTFLASLLLLWEYPINEQRRQEMRESIKSSMHRASRAVIYGTIEQEGSPSVERDDNRS